MEGTACDASGITVVQKVIARRTRAAIAADPSIAQGHMDAWGAERSNELGRHGDGVNAATSVPRRAPEIPLALESKNVVDRKT